MFDETYDKLVKISLVGDTCVGKTALTRRIINNDFSDVYNATICMDFHTTTVEDDKGTIIKIQIWDTSGQERFRCITPSYLRAGDVTLVCFACNDRDSFKSIDMWIKQLQDNNVKTKLILIGTKCDLSGVVKDKEANECAERYRITYIKTSSVSGLGRDELLCNIYSYANDICDTENLSLRNGNKQGCCVIL